ncbi:MAG: hypothetical protein SFX73_27640 [Kofleriaceae bacterium]|nr:hypothetical protein [Kofleriaceae bacterium]
MASLDEVRAQVAATRGDDHAHARAVLELAEREPLLGNRIAPVKAAIDGAAVVLDRVGSPEQRARLLLRLASLKIVETDYDGADKALHAVGDQVPDHEALRFLTGVRACRIALRRGPEDRNVARDMLLASAARLPDFDTHDTIWQRVTSEVVLGAAEVGLHDEPSDAAAFAALDELLDALAGDPAQIDLVFWGTQLRATYWMSLGDGPKTVAALRAVLKIAREVNSPADEVEARLALAGVLVELGDAISLDEAAHHVQIGRDRALAHNLSTLHQAALIAQAGVLSHQGKTAGAIDRMLELARSAAEAQDVPRYVAAVGIMADLYARSGDAVAAFRTIAESNHALSQATRSDATPLFRPLLAALRDRIGSERLEQIAADIAKASRLSRELDEKRVNNPTG